MAQPDQRASKDSAGASRPSDAMDDDSLTVRDVVRRELGGLPHAATLSVGVSRYQAAVEILERDVVCREGRGIVARGMQADDVTKALAVKGGPVELGIRKRHTRQASGNIRDDEE